MSRLHQCTHIRCAERWTSARRGSTLHAEVCRISCPHVHPFFLSYLIKLTSRTSLTRFIGGDLLSGKRCDETNVMSCSLRTPPWPLLKASDAAAKSATNMKFNNEAHGLGEAMSVYSQNLKTGLTGGLRVQKLKNRLQVCPDFRGLPRACWEFFTSPQTHKLPEARWTSRRSSRVCGALQPSRGQL